jgi:hypothetical protein
VAELGPAAARRCLVDAGGLGDLDQPTVVVDEVLDGLLEAVLVGADDDGLRGEGGEEGSLVWSVGSPLWPLVSRITIGWRNGTGLGWISVCAVQALDLLG